MRLKSQFYNDALPGLLPGLSTAWPTAAGLDLPMLSVAGCAARSFRSSLATQVPGRGAKLPLCSKTSLQPVRLLSVRWPGSRREEWKSRSFTPNSGHPDKGTRRVRTQPAQEESPPRPACWQLGRSGAEFTNAMLFRLLVHNCRSSRQSRNHAPWSDSGSERQSCGRSRRVSRRSRSICARSEFPAVPTGGPRLLLPATASRPRMQGRLSLRRARAPNTSVCTLNIRRGSKNAENQV